MLPIRALVTYITEVNNLTVRVHQYQKTTSRISKSTHGYIRMFAIKLICRVGVRLFSQKKSTLNKILN